MAAFVTLHNPSTGEVRRVRAGSVPFFVNQGFQQVDVVAVMRDAVEGARQATADLAQTTDAVTAATPETSGRHEAPEPADAADPGASTTTPDPTSKEN